MSGFVIRSLVLSAVLTILLNAFLVWRGRRAADEFVDRLPPPAAEPRTVDEADGARDRPTVKVILPWKAMLIGSIGLTVLLNVVAWLAR